MQILNLYLSPEIIRALGWTLVHSLWQGTLIAFLAGLALIFLKKNSAAVRYLVLYISLFLVLAVSGITFYRIYSNPGANPMKIYQTSYVATSGENQLNVNQELNTHDSTFAGITLDRLKQNFEQQSPTFVLIWFIGFIIFLMKYLGGIIYVQRLRNYRNTLAGEEWQLKLKHLASRIGIRKPVRLVESALVNVPMVIGSLKPIILLPLGTLGGVPPAQLDAILVHELAHIYRRDYLLNLLQSFVEALFFFHPAVWWLSSAIRQEREHICDDVTLKHTHDTINYIKALTNMENYSEKKPLFASALTGKKQHLLKRVKRMLDKKAFSPAIADHLIVPFIIFLAIIALTASAAISLETSKGKTLIPDFSVLKSDLPVMTMQNTQQVVQSEVPAEPTLAARTQKTKSVIVKVSNLQSSSDPGNNYFIQYFSSDLPDTLDEATRKKLEAQVEQAKKARAEAQKQMEEALKQSRQAQKQLQRALQEKNQAMNEDFREKLEEQLQQLREQSDSLDGFNFTFKLPDDFNYNYNWKGDIPQPCIPDSDFFKEFKWNDKDGNFLYFNLNGEDTVIGLPHTERIFIGEDGIRREMDKKRDMYDKQRREIERNRDRHDRARIDRDVRAYVYSPHDDLPGIRGFRHVNPTEKIIRQELRTDGLIREGKSYVIELKSNSMYINGEKQPKDVFKKYKRLYESLENEDLSSDNAYKLVF